MFRFIWALLMLVSAPLPELPRRSAKATAALDEVRKFAVSRPQFCSNGSIRLADVSELVLEILGEGGSGSISVPSLRMRLREFSAEHLTGNDSLIPVPYLSTVL